MRTVIKSMADKRFRKTANTRVDRIRSKSLKQKIVHIEKDEIV